MSTKHENPYREGSQYHKVFAIIKTKQVVTRKEVLEYAMGPEVGMTEAAAQATVTVLLSPRLESKRGDCRGNLSAAGHLYYMEKLGRKIVDGKKEPQKYRLRWREAALANRTRKEETAAAVNTETVAEPVAVETVTETVAEAVTDVPTDHVTE